MAAAALALARDARLPRSRVTGSTGWLYALLVCALGAAFFFGANGALDALHGSQRGGPAVAAHLGGLELWFVLLPGAASVALAGAVHAAVRRRARC